MGLSQTDPRFKSHQGQLIGLSSWNSARRPSVRSAVVSCLAERSEVAVPDFLNEVIALVDRPVQRGEVTNALLQLGWRRQGPTDTYAPVALEEDE